jgi:hypothetical protein
MEFMVSTIDPQAIKLLPQNDSRGVKIVSNRRPPYCFASAAIIFAHSLPTEAHFSFV